MKTLSVVLATFNEEKNLASCIESFKDIADEIIIVDGASTDKTVEIAKKYGAKVKITTNKENFHINKQMAIDIATSDWVLQMDADEQVSPELAQEIKSILNHQPSTINHQQINGYWMPRKNWFLGRFLMKGGQYPDYTIRLYRNGKGKLPQKDVHEQAVIDGKVGYLKSALLHYPYKNFSHYLKKWNFYNNFYSHQIKEEQKTKNFLQKTFYGFMYLLVRPAHWFFTTYFRHKGFMDGWQGFLFSFVSALRFPVSYIKYVGTYKFLAAVIIIIASILRLWNFPLRWGLGGDDSRDAIIALESIKRLELPLTGSFSSAGPFVFGPIFYWFIMLSYLALPFFIGAPWVMMEITSIITVVLLMYLGKILIDEKFSIIMGILAAFSPQLVVRSLSLGQHTFVATFSALSIICFLLLWKKKNHIYSFLMGLSVGVALSMHYQSINLLVFFLALFFITSLSVKDKVKALFFSLTGFFIASLPIIYWDSQQGFANTLNILDYFLIGVGRIYVPNSWKLYLFQDFPAYWSFVVGRLPVLGLVLFFTSSVFFLFYAFKKKVSAQLLVLGFIFLLFVFINRFYRAERSEGYLIYLLPFILIFSSFVLYKIWNLNIRLSKAFVVLSMALIILFSVTYILIVINYPSPRFGYEKVINNLTKKFPNTKFSLYDYTYKFYGQSMGLSLIMRFRGISDVNGKKIGFSCIEEDGCPKERLPAVNKEVFLLVDLGSVKSQDFEKDKKIWINVNQPTVYDDLVGWLNKYQLKSTFSLQKYLIEKINLNK